MGRAGRLNAAGVSIFYGAETAEVALAEVRPPVGSRVVLARFVLLRPVRLLDIDALRSLLVEGSLFDPEHHGRLAHAAFLSSFSRRFTQPVMPDHEAYEYITTQAVADYLANEVEPVLDGILYTSPQSSDAGKNVALFHRSSRVERVVTPGGTQTDVWFGHQTDDGYEIDYTVYEQVPAPAEPAPRRPAPRRRLDILDDTRPPILDDAQPPILDTPAPTLRIDLESVQVRHINSVEVRTDAYEVTRMRSVQGRNEF
jgi:hypothetical protein